MLDLILLPEGIHAGRGAGSVVSVMSVHPIPESVLAQEPTGLSSTVGQLGVLIGLLASLTLLLRWWWQNRSR